jgi:hypothetical protein
VGLDDMARSAVEAVADRLAQRGTDAAGRLTDSALDGVYQLIAHRLSGSATGRRVLDLLVRNPVDRQNQARAAEMLTDEAAGDPRFADSLGRAAAHAGVFLQGSNYHDARGDLRDFTIHGSGNKITNKKYRIGSIRFGTGGLVSGIVALVVLAGGGTAAVVAGTKSVDLSSAVGNWSQQPGGQTIPGWAVGPITLTVGADGTFTFAMRATMAVPSDAPAPAGFGDLSLDCTGTITADGDHFTLRTTTGQCGTFEAQPGPSDVLDVFIDNGSANGSIALTRTG